MKNVFKALAIITLVGLVLYAGYLCYEKLIKKSDSEDWDDLEDWGYEFEDEDQAKEISFTERVKAAAERQLEKAR